MAAPLITWNEPLEQLLSFVGTFLAAGAIGFRFTGARSRSTEPNETAFFETAKRRAALFGFLGAAIGLAFVLVDLPGAAARAHESVTQLLASNATTSISVVTAALVLIALGLAAGGARAAWTIAAVALLVETLAPLIGLKWTSVVNPIHRLAAGLWLGTLLILILCGLTPLLAHGELRERRGTLTAEMVNRFSPVALSMGGVVVVFGVVTAWRHLPTIASLWQTPYGDTLIVKLLFVTTVFGLGAFNWRRQRPSLGAESAAISIRRSARVELTVAAIVLLITAILVSLPSPKRAPTPRPAAGEAPRAPALAAQGPLAGNLSRDR